MAADDVRQRYASLLRGMLSPTWQKPSNRKIERMLEALGEEAPVRKVTEHTRLALASSLRPEILETVRDTFLSGDDAAALALLAHELGLVQIASPCPPYRPLKIGDTVVVIAYGKVLNRIGTSSSPIARPEGFVIELFSEGLGYGGPGADASTYRRLDVMPDELRYCDPPALIEARVPRSTP